MIKLSRINGIKFILNAELIEQVESTPDTLITLVGGKTLMVAESIQMVMSRVIRYKIRVNRRQTQKKDKHAVCRAEKS